MLITTRFRVHAAVGLACLIGAVGLIAPVAARAATAPQASSSPTAPTSIPVLDWHELDNGCASTVPVCNAADPESVSTAQLTAQLAYLKAQGYHTISAQQYLTWAEGGSVSLPANPIFLVADNGIANFITGAAPILKADAFTMAIAVITGFADGASGRCPEVQYEPGCPSANSNWDATWTKLRSTPSSVYSFITEAGTAGHFPQTYDPTCTAFYACKVPGETDTAYQHRVQGDLTNGQLEITQKLGTTRFTSGLWVVPFSDDGYSACSQPGCTPQPYDGPAGWLPSWTASTFGAAFVEDAFRNGIQHDRFRIDVKGWMTEAEFEGTLTQDLAAGDFTLANTPPPPPPPPPPPTSTTPVPAIPVISIDSATVTQAQFVATLQYLRSGGYHTIGAADYVNWAEGNTVALPASPVLIAVTGDNASLLTSITPNLVSNGDSAVDMVSSGSADAGGTSATWAQLAGLAPAAWQFAFAAGAQGATRVTSDPASCNVFYACESPGETDAAYQTRIANEIGAGRLELDNGLWMRTVSDFIWSVPFGDAGQPGQPSNGPAGWFPQWASWVFPVVLVSGGAAGNNEHNTLQVTGATTQASFEATLASDLANGTFGH